MSSPATSQRPSRTSATEAPEPTAVLHRDTKQHIGDRIFDALGYPTQHGMSRDVSQNRGRVQLIDKLHTHCIVADVVEQVTEAPRTANYEAGHFLRRETNRLAREGAFFHVPSLSAGDGILRRTQKLAPVSDCTFDVHSMLTLDEHLFAAAAAKTTRSTDDVTYYVIPLGQYSKLQASNVVVSDNARYTIRTAGAWDSAIWTMQYLDERHNLAISTAPDAVQRLLHAYLYTAKMPFAIVWTTICNDLQGHTWLQRLAADADQFEQFVSDLKNCATTRHYFGLVPAKHGKEWVFNVTSTMAVKTGERRIELCWFDITSRLPQRQCQQLSHKMLSYKTDGSERHEFVSLAQYIERVENNLFVSTRVTLNKNLLSGVTGLVEWIAGEKPGEARDPLHFRTGVTVKHPKTVRVGQVRVTLEGRYPNALVNLLASVWPSRGLLHEEAPNYICLTSHDWGWPRSDRLVVKAPDGHCIKFPHKDFTMNPGHSLRRIAKRIPEYRHPELRMTPPRRQNGDVNSVYWHTSRQDNNGLGADGTSDQNFAFAMLPEKSISPIVTVFAMMSATITMLLLAGADALRLVQNRVDALDPTTWCQWGGIHLVVPGTFSSLAALTFATSLASLTLEIRTSRTSVVRNLMRPLHVMAMKSMICLWLGLGLVFFRVSVVTHSEANTTDALSQTIHGALCLGITAAWAAMALGLLFNLLSDYRRVLYPVRPFMVD